MNGAKALFAKYYKWPVLAITSLLLVFSMLLVAGSVSAGTPITITPIPSGTTGISIDTSAAAPGGGTWTGLGTLSGPVITEHSVGQLIVGFHTLVLPSGWEFNQGQNVTIGLNPTELLIGALVVTPSVNTITFYVSAPSLTVPAILTFSDIQIKPTGTVISSATSGYFDGGSLVWGTFSTGPGVATHYSVTDQNAGTEIAGIPFSVTVTAYDQFGNIVGGQNTGANNYTGAHTVNWTWTATNSPNNTAPTKPLDGTQTFNAGVAIVGGFTLTNSGQTPTITATDTVISGTSAAITVQPGAALTFVLQSVSPGQDAGTANQLTITAKDVEGNVVGFGPNAQSSYAITFSGAATIGSYHPTVTDSTSAAINFGTATTIGFTSGASSAGGSMVLYTAESASITATANAGAITSNTLPISVNPAAAASYAVTTPGTKTAGTPFSVTLTALDTYGNVVSSGAHDYNVTDSITWSSTAHNSPNNTAFTLPVPAGQTFAHGVVTVGGFTLVNSGETPTITATGATLSGISAAITVQPATAASFTVVNTHGGTETAGVSFSVTLTALDAYSNILNAGPNNYTGAQTINWTWAGVNNSPNTTFPGKPGDGSQTFSSGIANIGGFTLTNAGDTATITATDPVHTISGSTGTITVQPGAAATFAITGTGATMNAGDSKQLTITALDVDGNTATSYNTAYFLTFSGASNIGTFYPTVTDAGPNPTPFGTATQVNFSNGISTGNAGLMVLYKAEGPISITATQGSITTSTAYSVTVSSLPASKFVITGTATQVAGTAQTLGITETDAYGNIKTAFTGGLALTFTGASTINSNVPTVTDSGAVARNFGVATTIHFTAGVSDVGGSMVLYKAESASISATAAGITTLTPLAVTVSPAAAASYTVTTPGTKTAGTSFSVTLTALDTYTNVANYNGTDSIAWTTSATFSPNGTTPTLAVDGNQTFASGVVTVSGFTLTNSGETPWIKATGPFTATSSAITVQPGIATTFSVTGGATQTAGAANALTITAKDADGNIPSFGTNVFSGTYGLSFSGALAINGHNPTVTDSVGTPTAFGSNTGITFTAGVSSAGGSMVLYKAGGPLSITATTFGITCLVPLSVTVNPATASAFTVAAASGTQVAGNANALTITAIDPYGNTDTAYAGVKSLTFSGASISTLGGFHPTVTNNVGSVFNFGTPENITFTGGVSTAGGSMVLYKVESASITATDTVISGTSTAITVTPAAAASYTVTTQNSGTETAGVPFSVTLTAFDAFGNLATNYNAAPSINWTSTATASPKPVSPTLAANGSQTFASGTVTVTGFTLTNSGESPTITATGSLSGVSGAITVQPGVAATFTITGTTPKNAGVANQLSITAKDVDGNVVSFGVNDYNSPETLTFSGASTIGLYVPTVTDNTAAPVNFGSPTTITFAHGLSSVGGSMVLYKAETALITATDGIATTPVPFTVVVNPGAAAKLGLSASATTLAAGTPTTLTTSEQDTYGNAVTTDSTSYVIFSVDGHATYVPHQMQVAAGVGTTVVSDTTAETIHVSVIANPWMTPPADLTITFTGFAVAITAPTAGTNVNGTSVPVTFTNNGGATSNAQISIDGGAFSTAGILNNNPGTYTLDTTGLTNGSHTIQVEDTVGGITSYSPIIGVNVNNDNTPTFSFTAPATGTSIANAASVAATYTVTNFTTGSVMYSVNGGTWTTAGDISQTIPVVVGINTIQLKATKLVGGVLTTGYSAIDTFTVQAAVITPVIPTVTLNGGSYSNIYTVSAATTRFTATSGVTFAVTNAASATVNGVAATITGGGTTVTADNLAGAITIGAHTYNVVVTSSTGNTASLLVDYQVTANNAPTLAITAPGAGATVSATQSISFTVSATADGGTAMVSIDGGTPVAATGAASPYTYSWNTTGLTNGTHTIQAQAAVGGTTGYSSIVSVTVSNIVTPTVTLNGAAITDVYTLSQATTRFTTTSGVTFAVTNAASATVNGVAATITGGGTTVTADNLAGATALGAHSYNVVVTSSSSTTASLLVTYQVTANNAPTLAITTPGAGATVSGAAQSISFTVSATADGGTAMVSIDGAAPVAATGAASPYTYSWNTTGLTNGTHTIQAQAAVGGTTGYSSIVSVTVSNIVTPTVTLNGAAITGVYTVSAATSRFATTGLTFAVTNAASATVNGVAVTITGGTTVTADNPTNAALLGAHTYNVVVTSSSSTTASLLVTYQVTANTAPTLAITAPGAGATVSATQSISFTVSATADGGTAMVSIDGGTPVAAIGAASPYTYSWNTTGLTNGTHTIQAQAAVGGTTGYSSIVSVTVSNIVTPTVTLVGPTVNGVYTISAATSRFTATSGITFTVSNAASATVNGVAATITGGTTVTADNLAGAIYIGTHTYNVMVTSSSGTTASLLVTYQVTANNAPAVVIIAPTAGQAVTGSPTVGVSTNSGAPTGAALYQIDGSGTWVGLATAWNTTILANGSHTVQAQDTVSGVIGYSNIITVVVNNGNTPTFSFNNPIPGTSIANTTAVTANYTVGNFDTGTVKYSINGGTWTTAIDNTQSIPVMVGINTLQLKATKTIAGVATTGYSAIDTFTVNSLNAPVEVIAAPAAGGTVSGTTTVTFTTNTGATTAAFVSIDGGNWITATTNANPGTYTWNTVGLTNGTHTIQVMDTVSGVAGYSSIISVTTNNAVTFSSIAVTGITSTGATIAWNTNANSTANSVAYGNTYTLGSTQTASGSGATAHTATLTGLTLNTTYYFQLTSSVGGQAATTDVYSFTTTPSNSGIAVSIQTIKSFAVADSTFTNGWEFKFTITDNVNTDTQLQMKFNDWMSSNGVTIAANGNMKMALDDNVAGVQAGTDGVTIGNAYNNYLTITDQNPNVGGIQTVIYVYVSVPVGTTGGSFSTNYGIHTQ